MTKLMGGAFTDIQSPALTKYDCDRTRQALTSPAHIIELKPVQGLSPNKSNTGFEKNPDRD